MNIKFGRVAAVALAAEVIGVLVLVAIVAVMGPSGQTEAQAYAESLGLWVGPIAGFICCLFGALWVAKSLPRGQLANGVALGIAAAALDVGLIVAAGGPFKLIFAVSNAGRVAAGALGGWFAYRRAS